MEWGCGRQLEVGFKVSFENKVVKFKKDKWCEDTPLRELFPKLYSMFS